MKMMIFTSILIVYSLFLLSVCDGYVTQHNTILQHSETRLYGTKHRGRYNSFIDTLPSKPKTRNPILDEMIKNIKPELMDSNLEKSGTELRKSRNRDLKIAKIVNTAVDVAPPPKQVRKWSKEEIGNVINCLNLSYGNRARNELSDDQRLGIIDWAEFDLQAEETIEGYNQDQSPKVRAKVFSWITFHIRKRDIRFDYDRWMWDPKPDGQRRQIWRKNVVKQLREKKALLKKEDKRKQLAEYSEQ